MPDRDGELGLTNTNKLLPICLAAFFNDMGSDKHLLKLTEAYISF